MVLTAGVSFLDSGTGANILFSIILCLFSMRIYSGYKPFVDEKLDKLAELMQWQLIFTMVAALAMKANLAEESEQNQRKFDVLLVLIQFGSASVIAVGTLGDKLKTGKLNWAIVREEFKKRRGRRSLKRLRSGSGSGSLRSGSGSGIEMASLEKEDSLNPIQGVEEKKGGGNEKKEKEGKEKKVGSALATRGAAAEATLGGEEMETETKNKNKILKINWLKRQTLIKRRNDDKV